MKFLILIIALIGCIALMSCESPKKPIKKTTEKKGLLGKIMGGDKGDEAETAVVKPATPREQLNSDFSMFKYLWFLIGAAGAVLIGFGAWLNLNKGMICAGAALLGVAVGGPVLVYVFKTIAIVLCWILVVVAVAAVLWGLYALVKYIQGDREDIDSLIQSVQITKGGTWADVKDKVLAVQDKALQMRVTQRKESMATKL